MTIVAPGGCVGILGGGQLGRMLALAAARLGLDCAVYAPEPNPPASRVVARFVQGGYDDLAAIRAFAASCDAVTCEFENVPAAALAAAAESAPVRPGPRAFAAASDRVEEKRFLQSLGLAVAPWAAVEAGDDPALFEDVFGPHGAILKTRTHGYDGKGQARLAGPGELAAAHAALGGRPAILERMTPFKAEASQIVVRRADGAAAAYDLVRTVHAGGVLREATGPGGFDPGAAAFARRMALTVADALDYVGVLALELFVMDDGALLANEMAPRVHNSGHMTPEAAPCGQFEQHIRAVCGWPLGETAFHARGVMTNLLGEDALDWERLAAEPGLHLHLYGKDAPHPGRKMGHTVRIESL